ncbi:MAG: LacI family transcriptional regulator [Turicibacter sp.]|nr:LacI family transcriptional regulator [Turicibacter sp.]
MANIKDVAKKANVSVATVSRVINNKGYVNHHTRSLVEAAIKELNYVPNEVARSLFRKSSKTIGIVLYDLKNEFFNEMISQMEALIFKHGYQTTICTIGDDTEREKTYLRMFKTNKIAGLIICADISPSGINELPDIPLVSLERLVKDSNPSIDCDNVMGGELAAKKLAASHCKHILQFTGPLNLACSEERSVGFLNVLADFPDVFVHSLELDFNTFTEAEISDFIVKYPEVDGVFAASDRIAAVALKCLKKAGKRIPEDVKVIGFDNISIAQMTDPTLTTISQPIHAMSELATNTLFKLINKEEIDQLHQIIPVELIEREST